MAHQMGKCYCGRKIHLAKNSRVGETWKCYNCRTVWTISSEGGQPTRTVGSKKPTRQQQQQKRQEEKRQVQKEQNQKVRQKQQHNKSSQSSSASCFPKGTQILTPNGSKDISELNVGDYVVSIGQNKEKCISKVLKVKNYSNKVLWSIKFNDGSSIKTTSSHSFFSGKKWVKSSNLTSGDSLSYYNNGPIVNKIVTSSSEIPLSADVYNIYVENNFNFIADGMIAHSFSYFRLTRIALWSIYSTLTQNDLFGIKNIRPQINPNSL